MYPVKKREVKRLRYVSIIIPVLFEGQFADSVASPISNTDRAAVGQCEDRYH